MSVLVSYVPAKVIWMDVLHHEGRTGVQKQNLLLLRIQVELLSLRSY